MARNPATLHYKGLPAQGTVTDFQKVTRSTRHGMSTTFHPVVDFTPGSGAPVRFVSSMPPFARPRQGDTVPVLYLEDKPQDAMIDGGAADFLFPAVFGLAGIFLLSKGMRATRAEEVR